jgi:hypothetical protein
MERMNIRFFPAWIALAILMVLYAACSGYKNPNTGSSAARSALTTSFDYEGTLRGAGLRPAERPALDDIAASLEQIAEIERNGDFSIELARFETDLRESVGDFAGAIIATFKGVSWLYGYGIVTGDQVEQSLINVLDLLHDRDMQGSAAASAALGCMAFLRGEWAKAEVYLTEILTPDEEPDSFIRWMLLVCALEQIKAGNDANNTERATRSAYGAIRARYALFPEYWYRGARNISVVYAEQCIIVNQDGPFVGECRDILAAHLGISSGRDLLVGVEVEEIIRLAVEVNEPKLLEELFPLMALPDNPYNIYALGALQALASIPEFRAFFGEMALQSHGRLAERLNFIFRS